jgi:hypothetical protein
VRRKSEATKCGKSIPGASNVVQSSTVTKEYVLLGLTARGLGGVLFTKQRSGTSDLCCGDFRRVESAGLLQNQT